jgi:hypothetical protein
MTDLFNKPLVYREVFFLGSAAYRAGALRSNNPYYSERSTPVGRMKYSAWARGWVDECYKEVMRTRTTLTINGERQK